MTNHSQTWLSVEIDDLSHLMKTGRGSQSTLFKRHAKKYGRTKGAVYAKWKNITEKKAVKNIAPSLAKQPPTAKVPDPAKFDNLFSRLEKITGHKFTPSEIVEISKV